MSILPLILQSGGADISSFPPNVGMDVDCCPHNQQWSPARMGSDTSTHIGEHHRHWEGVNQSGAFGSGQKWQIKLGLEILYHIDTYG